MAIGLLRGHITSHHSTAQHSTRQQIPLMGQRYWLDGRLPGLTSQQTRFPSMSPPVLVSPPSTCGERCSSSSSSASSASSCSSPALSAHWQPPQALSSPLHCQCAHGEVGHRWSCRCLWPFRMLVALRTTDRPPNPRLHNKCPGPSLCAQLHHRRALSLEWCSSRAPSFR
jgi:hypothetical protein